MTRLALATLAAIIATMAAALLAVAALAGDVLDPCAGHVTPDGITADAMGPCDEMPDVP